MANGAEFTATGIAARVRAGALTPVQAVQDSLRRIAERDPELNAFVRVRTERALDEADAVARRTDLDTLPLAGVPVAVKDCIPVAGEPLRVGSDATPPAPSAADHVVVTRLRAAGAVVVGLSAVPELGAFALTDRPTAVTRNPWNRDLSVGGSSGGSACAVAAGMVPVAHGADGLGSIRNPAACCGVFAIKPGAGVVPADVGVDSWGGLVENGALATTVADGALVLAVLAGRPELAAPEPPSRVRVALSVGAPSGILRVDRHWTAGARRAASTLVAAGHLVETAQLNYQGAELPVLARWAAGTAREAATVDARLLQRRTKRQAAIGRAVERLRLVRDRDVDRIELRMLEYFERFDVVITPTLARVPPQATTWSEQGWLANVVACARYAPFAAIWNLVGWPAATVPMGVHPSSRTPLAAQLAGPPGSEALLLALAAEIERRRPWTRTAP